MTLFLWNKATWAASFVMRKDGELDSGRVGPLGLEEGDPGG